MGRSTVTGSSDYYSTGLPDEAPEHAAFLSPFALDKYEVTVGRFRKFVEAYTAWRLSDHPAFGEGANPNATNTGWGQSWALANDDLLLTSAELAANVKCPVIYHTWSDMPGTNESTAINCVTWYEAFAFCIWDGGRLPSEAEWENAAAGGPENRLYPWGSASPNSNLVSTDGEFASTAFDPVGSKPSGAGYYGHLDLAGSRSELVFDWYSETMYGTADSPRSCMDCANTGPADFRARRGGCWIDSAGYIRAASRDYTSSLPNYRHYVTGFRCARAAQ